MGEVEPGGALVVEVGEGPFFEFLGALGVFGEEAEISDGADSFSLSLWERAGVRVLVFLATRPRTVAGRGRPSGFEIPLASQSLRKRASRIACPQDNVRGRAQLAAAQLIRDYLGELGSHLHQLELLHLELQSQVAVARARGTMVNCVAQQLGDDVAGILQVLG